MFVFGSNLQGRHGKGAALHAKYYWGAIEGLGVGRQGDSYAIPTKDVALRPRPLSSIEHDVRVFVMYAENHPEIDFDVTPIGCGLSGFMAQDIAPMFETAPPNVHLPLGWRDYAA